MPIHLYSYDGRTDYRVLPPSSRGRYRRCRHRDEQKIIASTAPTQDRDLGAIEKDINARLRSGMAKCQGDAHVTGPRPGCRHDGIHTGNGHGIIGDRAGFCTCHRNKITVWTEAFITQRPIPGWVQHSVDVVDDVSRR